MIRRSYDANHGSVKRTFERLGAYVFDCAHVGGGFPDLVVFWRGRGIFVEVKDGSKPPSDRKLRPSQLFMHAEAARCGVPVHVVTSEDEAMALLGARAAA